jgi:hypothetical protein
LAQAARELKVSETHLKRLCRACFGINRWPFRKIEALKNMREKLQEAAKKDGIAYRIEEKIKSIDAELELIRKTGNHSPSGPNTKSFRIKKKDGPVGVSKKRGRKPKAQGHQQILKLEESDSNESETFPNSDWLYREMYSDEILIMEEEDFSSSSSSMSPDPEVCHFLPTQPAPQPMYQYSYSPLGFKLNLDVEACTFMLNLQLVN